MTEQTCPARHKHAATSTCYTLHMCRCSSCRQGNALRAERRRKDIAYGRHAPRFADAAPARAHVAQLRKAGMPLAQIAAAAGVNRGVVDRIANGRLARVNRSTASKVMRVEFTQSPFARISAIGAQRRLQALAFMGWTNEQIGSSLDSNESIVPWVLRHALITPELHERIATSYDRLWSQTPPDSYGNRRAATRARTRGWHGPLAWDDEQIDSPDARPAERKEAV